MNGITKGFEIPSNIESDPLPPNYKNHRSSLQHFKAVSSKLDRELAEGKIAGPFPTKPPGVILSPLAAVPKKDSNDIRIIHDLSFPLGNSVNSHIPRELCRVEYELFDVCLDIVLKIGRGCLMAKTDIKTAFRILPISPLSYHLLGFSWDGSYFVEKALPMGCSLSCNKFELFSNAIQWILTNKMNVKHMSHILDDFLFFGHPSSNECNLALQSFLHLSTSLNIPIKHEKTVLPTTRAQLHGLIVDSNQMLVILPQDKKDKAIQLLNQMSKQKSATLNQLQILIGTLQFATKAIISGRTFLRRLIDLTKGIKGKHHHIRLNTEARLDIKMWLSFLVSFNGKRIISPQYWVESSHLRFFSDASGSGFAAINGSSWFMGTFPPSWKNVNIATKELLPITLSFRMWSTKLKGSNLIFMVDNMSVVNILQSQTSNDPEIMNLLRPMVVSSMINDVQFYAFHIPGKSNTIADLMSRFQVQKAKNLAPWLDPLPLDIPHQWLPW